VITLGGDGLAGAVAGELRGTRAVLSVLPGGRGNDFLRKLGIPQDVRAACAIALHGRIRAIDVADLDGRAFLGIASAGFDSDVQVIANRTRLPLGRQVYVYGALRAMVSWKPAQWRVTVDGKDRAFPGYSVAVANSGFYGGGMQLVPAAQLDDGLLDVVLAGNVSKLRYLRVLPKVFKGTHMPAPKLEVLRGRVIRFQADRPFDVYADGDPIAPMPVTIRVQPGVLRVMAPHA
jgi:YegS/Rv2252/BmrU family lipid kinase